MFATGHPVIESLFGDNAPIITKSASYADTDTSFLWKLQLDSSILSDGIFPTSYVNQTCFFDDEVQAMCKKATLQQQLLTSQQVEQKGQIEPIEVQQQEEKQESYLEPVKVENGEGSSNSLNTRLTVTTERNNVIVKSESPSGSHNLQEINEHQQQLKINQTLNLHSFDKFIAILKKREYRLDQIFKVAIRYLSKQARESFHHFMKENQITQAHPSDVKDALLKLFIRQNFNLVLKPDQIDTAKSFFFCFSLKTKQPIGLNAKEKVARLRNSFVEKGTLKQALTFFSSQVGLQCFFKDFIRHILEAVRYTSYEGRRLYVRGLRKLIQRIRNKKHSDRILLREADEIIDSFGP